jgi:hypothetical protein
MSLAVPGPTQTRARLELRSPLAGKWEKLTRKRGSRFGVAAGETGMEDYATVALASTD